MFSKKFFQKKLINSYLKLCRVIFHPITAEDILGIEFNGMKPVVMFRGKEMDKEQISLIKENAENFEKSILWKFIENRIKYTAQEKMFPLSSVDNDLLFGKAMLFELDVMKQVLKEIKNIPN